MNLLKKYITMFRADMKEVMSHRCGLDELNNFIMLIGFIFIVTALLSHKWIFTLIGAVFVVLCYIRVFSQKLEKRKKENDIYMKYMGSVVRKAAHWKLCLKMKIKSIGNAEYAYFVCSKCGQVIRIPKGKNKVSIRCPKCNETFIKRT